MKAILAISLLTGSLWAQGTSVLSLEPGSGTAGGTVILNLNLIAPAESLPAGLQWTITYSRDVASLGVEAGPALASAGKTLSCNDTGGSITCLAVGFNANPIGVGAVAVVTVRLSEDTRTPLVVLPVENTFGVSADGLALPVNANGSAIAVSNNPLPEITSLNPSSLPAGGLPFILSVFGNGFVSGSVVNWNGFAKPTSFISSTQLNAAISASDIGLVDTALISVSNPSPGGGASSPFVFLITGSLGPVPPRPFPGTVDPAAGSGSSATLSFTFNDPRGWADLDVVNILIGNVLDGRQSCYLAYSISLNVLYLMNDPGMALLPALSLNDSGSRSNSQCTVSATGSPVTGSGNTLMLTLNFSFTERFAGNKLIYLAAGDRNKNNSGWQPLGTWSVPGSRASLTARSVSPARGSGPGRNFTFTFSDDKGYQDLGVVNILINDALDGRQGCYLAYSRPAGVLYLMNDAGTSLLPGLPLSSTGIMSNSQCTVRGSGSVVAGGGNTLALTFNLTFSASFAGNRAIYLAARDTGELNNTDWQSMGTWTVQ